MAPSAGLRVPVWTRRDDQGWCSVSIADTLCCWAMPWEIEIEPEVQGWLDGLGLDDFAQAAAVLDRLAERGNTMRMPHSRALGEGLFELRFVCEGVARRISYWFAPDRRIVLLTTFRKTKDNERREISRARAALARCRDRHEGRRDQGD